MNLRATIENSVPRLPTIEEEPMKSLSELADIYEKWATANEATAEEILACIDSLQGDVREQQRWRASQVMAEATALRTRAAELRRLERGIAEELHPVSRTRYQSCESKTWPTRNWIHVDR